jgi:hypothetical protein
MAQNEYEKIVKAMADKGVPHWAFELLADLRHNESMNSQAIDGIEFAVAAALKGFKDFENNDAHEGNYLQVIRKLTACCKKALGEIAENHSSEDKEVSFLKKKIEQLEKEKVNLYDRCLENEEAMYDAVIKGNDNHLIELVEQGVSKI